MKMLLTIFLKISHNLIEVMLVLMVMLLALKLVHSVVQHTCGGGHDLTCTAPLSAGWGGGGGVEPPSIVFKRGGA